jgi:predicted amidohydrolase
MQVAGVQFDIAWMKPEENIRRVRPYVREAADRGALLVVLPEMYATGFSMEVERSGAMAAAIRAETASMAREAGVAIVAGVAEAAPPTVDSINDAIVNQSGDIAIEGASSGGLGANMAYAWGADGAMIAAYQKVHPFSLAGEGAHIAGGDRAAIFELAGVRIGLAVCYDLRFPELFRAVADRVDLFVVPANWPSRRRTAWRALQQARAIDALSFVVGVNRLGDDAHAIPHQGDSLAVDPFGEIIAEAGDRRGPFFADIDPDHARTARDRFSFLRDRRPDVYSKL